MDAKLYYRAQRVFDELIDAHSDDLSADIARLCGNDAELEVLVRELVAMDDELGGEDDDGAATQLVDITPLAAIPSPDDHTARSAAGLLSPGDELHGYRALHRLGVGGAAEVWAVQHVGLGTTYALKVLLWAAPAMRTRLIREGHVQARLQHPNLLPVREILQLDGVPALLMPWVEGPTLRRLLSNYEPTQDECKALFAELLAGVQHAHEADVVHRDLKPDNVLLELHLGRVRPRISDFGIGKELSAPTLTVQGSALGTPAYAAPEQLVDASTAGVKADLFSLGVMWVELLTGVLPFAHDRSRIGAPETANLGGLAGANRDIAERLLAHDPTERPASAQDVLRMLGDVPSHVLSASEGIRLALTQHGSGRAQHTMHPTITTIRPANNLPGSRDAFIGRQQELADLLAWVRNQEMGSAGRLMTLTGMGGCGKTRLCHELGRSVRGEWTGVVWVDLSDAKSVSDMLSAASEALDVPLGDDPLRQIGLVLSGRGRVLVLIDNFEQVIDHANDTIGRWLRAAEEAVFVVTSRQPLRLRGERLFPVAPLLEDSAVQLFAERSKNVNPRFALTPAVRESVVALVEKLDRLPLAIELAAARSRMHSPSQLMTRIDQRFRLLTSRSRDLPHRQRTLRATLDWSWDLLQPEEQAALAQISVFEGGFTVEAAESVIDLASFGDLWVEDVLAELIDKSLVVRRRDSAKPRLALLISVQDYARERLTDTAGPHHRHLAYYARFGAESVLRDLHFGHVDWRSEAENLESAVHRATDGELAMRCALAAAALRWMFGPAATGRDVLDHALGLLITPWAQARLLRERAMLHQAMGQYDRALHDVQQVLALLDGPIADSPEADWLQAQARQTSADVLDRLGRPDEALEHIQHCLRLYTDLNDVWGLCTATSLHGIWLKRRGHVHEAYAQFVQSRQYADQVGDLRRTAAIDSNIGVVLAIQDKLGQARTHFTRSIEAQRSLGNRHSTAIGLGNLGQLAALQGRLGESERYLVEALTVQRQVGNRTSEAASLCRLAGLYLEQGRHDDAERSYAEGLKILHGTGEQHKQGDLLRGQADLYIRTGRPARAVQPLTTALRLLEGVDNWRSTADTLAQLGEAQISSNDLDAARQTLQRLIVEVADRGPCAERVLMLVTMCKLAQASGDHEAARAAAVQAREHANQIRVEAESRVGRTLKDLPS